MDQPANLDARLNLPEALVRYQALYGILEAAFNELHHDAVALDAVVTIAQLHGYTGSVDQVCGILQVGGRFTMEVGPNGQRTIRRTGRSAAA